MFATRQSIGMGRVVLDAAEEARRRGDRRIGSDHLLLALLKDEDSVTARALGVDLPTARGALVEDPLRSSYPYVNLLAVKDAQFVKARIAQV